MGVTEYIKKWLGVRKKPLFEKLQEKKRGFPINLSEPIEFKPFSSITYADIANIVILIEDLPEGKYAGNGDSKKIRPSVRIRACRGNRHIKINPRDIFSNEYEDLIIPIDFRGMMAGKISTHGHNNWNNIDTTSIYIKYEGNRYNNIYIHGSVSLLWARWDKALERIKRRYWMAPLMNARSSKNKEAFLFFSSKNGSVGIPHMVQHTIHAQEVYRALPTYEGILSKSKDPRWKKIFIHEDKKEEPITIKKNVCTIKGGIASVSPKASYIRGSNKRDIIHCPRDTRLIINAGGGNDDIYLGNVFGFAFGKDGNDFIQGSESGDFLYGGKGNDRILGKTGSDTITGDDGCDVLVGGHGGDYLQGGNGHDVINGGSGDDYIWGNGGNDILDGGPGNDEIDGNYGYDIASYKIYKDNNDRIKNVEKLNIIGFNGQNIWIWESDRSLETTGLYICTYHTKVTESSCEPYFRKEIFLSGLIKIVNWRYINDFKIVLYDEYGNEMIECDKNSIKQKTASMEEYALQYGKKKDYFDMPMSDVEILKGVFEQEKEDFLATITADIHKTIWK